MTYQPPSPDGSDGFGPGDLPLPSSLSPRRSRQQSSRRAWHAGRTGWQRFGRGVTYVAVLTSFLVVFTAAGGYAYVRYLNGNINRISLAVGGDRPADTTATNFLLAGSDTRDGQDAGFQGTGAEAVQGQRSDSVLLVHLASNNAVTVLSFPRDSYVTIPAYTDPTTHRTTASRKDKLNSSFSEGGPTLLVQTIENLSGLRVDHFVQVDFSQFKNIVNSLGGIEVCLTQPAKDTFTGINLPAGRFTINGDQALQFVRQRYGLPLGDLSRINRQQRFLSAVIRKLTSTGTLLNPDKLNGFLTSVSKSITVDDDTSLQDLIQLGTRLKGLQAGGVQFLSLPYTELGHDFGGDVGDALVIDVPKATALFAALRSDTPLNPTATASASAAPAPSASTATLTIAPTSIVVAVQNGSGVSGRAVTVSSALQAIGFRSGGATNAAATDATTVLYPATLADSAATVAAAVPGSVLKQDSTVSVVTVVLGSNFTGVQPVTVNGKTYGSNSATVAPVAPTATTSTAPVATAANTDCGV